MANDLANLPISMLAPPNSGGPDLSQPPQVPAAMALQQALSTSQSPQSTEGPQPITTTPEWQSVMQAGQGSFGVPGFDAQGQPTQESGIKARIKHALSDAVFAIGEGLAYGPGAGIMAATGQGRAYVHQQRALEAEAARSAQLQQTGMALGRLYGGIGGMQRGAAAVQHQQNYAQLIPSLIAKYNAQAGSMRFKEAGPGLIYDTTSKFFVPIQFGPGGEPLYQVTPEIAQAAQKVGLGNYEPGQSIPPQLYNLIVNKAFGAQGTVQTPEGLKTTTKTLGGVQVGPVVGGAKAPQTKIMQGADGKLHIMGWDPEAKNFSKDMGIAPPSWAMATLPARTITVTNAQGMPEVLQYNPATQTYDRPAGTPGTGTYAHQIQSAHAVQRMIDGSVLPLLSRMQQAGEMGIIKGRFSDWLDRDVGNAPPDVAQFHQLVNGVVSMMMGLYGFRRQEAVEALDKQMGARMTPESMRAALTGIMQHAQSIIGSPPSFAKRAAAAGPPGPGGMITMTGPKGTFSVPKKNVGMFTKNGYKVVR